MAPSKSTQFVPLDTAAAQLSMSVKTIRRLIAEGTLTGYRIGPRVIRVDAAEVAALAKPIPNVKSA